MMHYGIPAYRLPREVLDGEIARVLAMGVEVDLNHVVHDVEQERRDGAFDAVFLAVGAQLGKRVDIPAGDSARVVDAVSFLHTSPTTIHRCSDVASSSTEVVTPPSTPRAPPVAWGRPTPSSSTGAIENAWAASGDEFAQALGEGVTVHWLSTISRVDRDRVVLEKMKLNDEGFPEPTGEFEELGADSLVLALGQDTDLSLLENAQDVTVRDGSVEVLDSMMASPSGIFAGGDAVPAQRTATVAIGHGKRAAHGIDDFLAGRATATTARHELASFGRLNTWYYAEAPRTERPELERVRRQTNFEEVVGGLSEDNALFEARRCMSCGNCFECDNCLGVCPDNAVIKLGENLRYQIDYDFCKGCGICVKECPCGAIDMVPERN